jgi:hypothetical protein
MSQSKTLRFLGVILVAAVIILGAGGCVRDRVVIKVSGDGSGNIIYGKVFTYEASQILEQAWKMSPRATMENFFKAEKERFGGVELSEVKYINEFGLRGWIAVYSFKDINAVTVPAAVTFVRDSGLPVQGDSSANRVSFKYDKSSGVLNVLYPEPQKFPDALPEPPPIPREHGAEMPDEIFGLEGTEPPIEVYRKLFSGMSYVVTVEKSDNKDKAKQFKIIDFDLDSLAKTDNAPLLYIFSLSSGRQAYEGIPLSPLDSKCPGVFNRQGNAKLEIK